MSSTESAPTKPSWIVRFLNKLSEGLLVSLVLGVAGLCVIAAVTLLSQGYLYLKTGAWPHWVLFTVVSEDLPVEFMKWILNPQDWYGLHKIAAWVFLQCPIVLITLGASVVWACVAALLLAAVANITEAVD